RPMVKAGVGERAHAPACRKARDYGCSGNSMSKIRKPVDWPRYMIAKRLADGSVAYYWNPRKKDIEGGFPIKREALGADYGQARIRCDGDPKDPDNRGLNGFLDYWRANRGADKNLDLMPGYGTVDWWFERYYRTDAFLKKVSDRSKPDYRRALKRIADVP